VHLPDRCSRDRCTIELTKGDLDRTAELLLDDRDHDLRIERWRGILELGELDLIGRRQQVGASRKDLPQLDEGGAKLFKGSPEMLRPRQRLIVSAVEEALENDESLQAGDADEEAKTVARKDLADLAIASCLRLRGDVREATLFAMRVDAPGIALLERVPSLAGKAYEVEPLEGGITNRNYRVVAGNEVLVLRVPAETGSLLGIDRTIEHAVSRLVASAGVGPEVIAFIEPEGALVTRFITGRPVTDTDVHDPLVLQRIAHSLRRVHHAGQVAATFSVFRVVEAYGVIARRYGVMLPDAFEPAQQIARQIEVALPNEAPVLCHNDLLNANFIDDGAGIRIVDWEYAAMGDRFFDFGNFAVNHQLAEGDELALLAAYYGRATLGQHARLRLMRIMSDFREAMWGVVQRGISTLDVDFDAYAGRHFDRLLGGAADQRFNTWLRQAAA
jgi:thiamine kinase-like enzyme